MIKTMADFEEVYRFFTREDFIGDITDDFSPDMFDVVKQLLIRNAVIMPTPGTCFVLSSINSITCEAHLNTTAAEKKEVYQNTVSACKWVMDNTTVRVFVSYIPVIYPSTRYYADKIGMKKTGTMPKAFLKHGEMVDMDILVVPVENIIREIESWQ